MIETTITEDIVELMVCSWLEDDPVATKITDYEVLVSDYDLNSALQYDMFIRRRNGV